jgi:hypothetical protein
MALPTIGATGWGTTLNDHITALEATVAGKEDPGAAVTVAQLPAGSTLTVHKAAGVWPARPTARGDIIVQWVGQAPAPTLVTSGTGGMRDDIDLLWVLP